MPSSSRPVCMRRISLSAMLALLAATAVGLVAAPAALADITYVENAGTVTLSGSGSPTADDDTVTASQSGTTVTFVQADESAIATAVDNCTENVANTVVCTAVTAVAGGMGSGTDTITFNANVTVPVRLSGETDDDTITGGSGADCLVGGANTGSGGIDTLNGAAGDDTLSGGNNGDTLSGGTGNDRLDGGADNDSLSGGDGIDRVLYGTNGEAVYDVSGCYSAGTRNASVVLTLGGTGGEGAEADTINADIESAIGGSGNDTLTGSAINNVLVGGDGADALNGAGGDDLLSGGLAGEATNNDDADIYDGGPGTDGVTYSNLTGGGVSVTIDGVGNDGLSGGTDNVQTSVEKVYGTAGIDTISGAGAPAGVSLFGNAGNDTLTGSAFNDFIDGGLNTDSADCGLGSDIAVNVETPTSCND